MSQIARQLVFSGMLCVISSVATAQATYKCGSAYSETPCVDGKALVNQDLRTEEQKRQADETTIRQKKAAGGFEKDRIAGEKQDAEALRKASSAVIIGKEAELVARKQSKSKLVKSPKSPKAAKPVKAAKKKKKDKPAA